MASLVLSSGIARSQAAPVSARSVPLLLPSAIAYDAAGNLYIAEIQGNAIRKVDSSGLITRVAGDGSEGFSGDGGPATAAQLDSPQGLAIDAAGNIYISDSRNHRIRRIDAVSGLIETVVGTGVAGFSGDGGPPIAATFNLPRAICLDPTGKQLYIADSRNHRIRHVDVAAQTIETYAGSGVQGFSGDGGPASAAALDSPESIAIDTSGNLLVADTQNGRVRLISAGTRIIQTIAGSGASSIAQLARPRGLTVDAQGNLFIVDSGNDRVLRVDHQTGAISVAVGSTTQGFGGDGSPASAAALDSPRALAFTPGGLLSIADTSNERVRQLLAAPALTTPIQTVAGLGVTVPGIFNLSAPAVEAYGSASITASLSADALASGQVTFLNVGDSSNTALGTTPLVADTAALDLPTLPVGQHRIMATYSGDDTHGAAQTPVFLLTISPRALRASANPVTAVYGSPLPQLSGTIEGLLPQDAAKASVSFTSSATASSTAGTYPVTATLSGPAASNYILQVAPANLVITQAASSVLLRNAAPDGTFTGALVVQVNTSTSGTPTGSITLLDGATSLQQVALSNGAANLSASNLGSGTHQLTAAYAGDTNFLPSTSPALTTGVASGASSDFSIAASVPSSQILAAGSSVSSTVSLQMSGPALNSPVALTVTGLPNFTTASFSPAYIPPGTTGTAVAQLTITSTASQVASLRSSEAGNWPSLAVGLPLPLLLCLARKRRHPGPSLSIAFAAVLLLCSITPLVGCGDRINPEPKDASSLQSYTLSITGTATSNSGATLKHSATLIVQTAATQ